MLNKSSKTAASVLLFTLVGVLNAQEVYMPTPSSFLKSQSFEIYQSNFNNTNTNSTGLLKDDEIQFGCTFYKDLAFYDLTPLKIFGPRVVT